MNITKDTRLQELLKAYPWLKTEITKISPKFKLLNTPLGKVMASKASVADMSEKSGVDVDLLIEQIAALVKEHSEE